MRKFTSLKSKTIKVFDGVGALLLLIGVACGSAAQPVEQPASASTTVAQPTAAPTAMVQVTGRPLEATAHPGKLTWMIGGWGNERFVGNYGVGGGNNYARIHQGFVIVTNEKAELLPGIATKWETSADGKTWTFTVREGGKFHNGTEITAEDIWWTLMHYFGKDESGSAVERATQGSAQAWARNVERVDHVSNNQASITLTSPNACLPIFISEASPHWYGVVPKRPKVHDSDQELAYDSNPVGSGPGKLIKHIPSGLMAFERFDDYYYQPKNGLPEDRRLKFTFLVMGHSKGYFVGN